MSPEPASAAWVRSVGALRLRCRLVGSAPDPDGSSRRWWVHGTMVEEEVVPRCFFGLGPAGLRGKPGHQALVCGPSVRAWLQTGAPGFLRAGSLLLYGLSSSGGFACNPRQGG